MSVMGDMPRKFRMSIDKGDVAQWVNGLYQVYHKRVRYMEDLPTRSTVAVEYTECGDVPLWAFGTGKKGRQIGFVLLHPSICLFERLVFKRVFPSNAEDVWMYVVEQYRKGTAYRCMHLVMGVY